MVVQNQRSVSITNNFNTDERGTNSLRFIQGTRKRHDSPVVLAALNRLGKTKASSTSQTHISKCAESEVKIRVENDELKLDAKNSTDKITTWFCFNTDNTDTGALALERWQLDKEKELTVLAMAELLVLPEPVRCHETFMLSNYSNMGTSSAITYQLELDHLLRLHTAHSSIPRPLTQTTTQAVEDVYRLQRRRLFDRIQRIVNNKHF